MSAPVHGGDLVGIGRTYGIDPADLLDFSANLNPLGPPPALLHELAAAAADIADLARYPDPDSRVLRAVLARELDIEPEAIVVGNGAAALLATALTAFDIRRCAVPTPAFSEDLHALSLVGATCVRVPLEASRAFALDPSAVLDAIRTRGADAALVTNPHNPSGALTSAESVLRLVAGGSALGAKTIVDEAFIDYAPTASIARFAVSDPNLIVLRSLTKFFAVPALRVGYALAAPDVARRMRAALPSWPITTLAERALTAAFDDPTYARTTIETNDTERTHLADELQRLGFHALPSAANFLLVALPPHLPRAPEITRRLIATARIVVRDCSSYEGLEDGAYIRVAVRRRADNARLLAALRTLT